MSEKQQRQVTDHWSDYWARGPLTSLPDDFSGNYDAEIAAFWNARFRDLPELACLLDICTGNGALALLAAEYAAGHQQRFEITAIDAASIRPDLVANARPELADYVADVKFLADMPMECFEGGDAQFDLAMSQYGIEYCDQAQVAPIIARLLKPGAELALVCHAADSDMVSTMRHELTEYRRLDALQLSRSLRSWLQGQLDSTRLREKLVRLAQAIFPEYRAKRSALFGFVLQAINQLVRLDERGLRARRDQIAQWLAQLDGGRQRLDDMLRVNELLASPNWYQPYIDAGLVLQDHGDLLYRQQHHAGQWFVFRKA